MREATEEGCFSNLDIQQLFKCARLVVPQLDHYQEFAFLGLLLTYLHRAECLLDSLTI